MTNLYATYKPLRNILKNYNLQQSIEDIWMLSNHLINNIPLPFTFGDARPSKVKDYLFRWDLPTLQREIVLHATHDGTKRLNTFASLALVINKIRDLENHASELFFESNIDNPLKGLHAIAHRQFPWQQKRILNSLMRYQKVFGKQSVENILTDGAGISVWQWYLMGLAVCGHLKNEVGINAKQNFEEFGIETSKSTLFFQKISIDIQKLREKTLAEQLYDKNWSYAYNPILATPLIAMDEKNPHLLHCPIPELLLIRISHGLFFDLGKIPGFNNPYGASFESYIGEVIKYIYGGRPHSLIEETPYFVDRNKKAGTDWVLIDTSANLFIECKAKRMSIASKMTFDPTHIKKQIDVLASAVVQLYKNINDAKSGITVWKINEKPIFPLVVTMEDWYMFGSVVREMLNDAVIKKLLDIEFSISLLDTMPYHILSAEEFEVICPIWAETGINNFFQNLKNPKYSHWRAVDYAREEFPLVWANSPKYLFKDEWDQMIPKFTEAIKLLN